MSRPPAADVAKLESNLQSQKLVAEIAMSERQSQELPNTPLTPEAADLQNQRADTPTTPESIEAARADRKESPMLAADVPAETAAVTTANAASMSLQEQVLEVARRAPEAAADTMSSSAPAVSRATTADPLATLAPVDRTAAAGQLSEESVEDGGTVEITRTTKGVMAATEEVVAESVTAGEAADANAVQVTESAGLEIQQTRHSSQRSEH